MHRISVLLSVCLVLGTASCGKGGAADRAEAARPSASTPASASQDTVAVTERPVTFRARVGDLMSGDDPLTAGKGMDDTVSVTLGTRLYDPPLDVSPVSKAEAGGAKLLDAIASDFSAFKVDDHDWIRANFAEADQAAVDEMLNNNQMAERQAKIFAGLEREKVHALVRVGGDTTYVLAVVTYDDQPATRVRPLTFVQEGGTWKRTNALSADARLAVVWTAFRKGLVAP